MPSIRDRRLKTGKGREIERVVGPKQIAQLKAFVDAYVSEVES